MQRKPAFASLLAIGLCTMIAGAGAQSLVPMAAPAFSLVDRDAHSGAPASAIPCGDYASAAARPWESLEHSGAPNRGANGMRGQDPRKVPPYSTWEPGMALHGAAARTAGGAGADTGASEQ